MNKKGFLFTIIAILLLWPAFTLTTAYIDRNKDMQHDVVESYAGDKLRFLEDDIVSNAYTDLLGIRLNSMVRNTSPSLITVNVSFNQLLLANGRDYYQITQDYQDFVMGTYASLNNVEINFSDFDNNFTIWPYRTKVEMQGNDTYFYTIPVPPNRVRKIYITVDVSASRSGNCTFPNNDGGENPEVGVRYVYSGGSCFNSATLDPTEDNDRTGGEGEPDYYQFYMGTSSPGGTIEVKYGRLKWKNKDGVLAIFTNGINANITQLDIEYNSTPTRVWIGGADLNITSVIGDISKSINVVVAEE